MHLRWNYCRIKKNFPIHSIDFDNCSGGGRKREIWQWLHNWLLAWSRTLIMWFGSIKRRIVSGYQPLHNRWFDDKSTHFLYLFCFLSVLDKRTWKATFDHGVKSYYQSAFLAYFLWALVKYSSHYLFHFPISFYSGLHALINGLFTEWVFGKLAMKCTSRCK